MLIRFIADIRKDLAQITGDASLEAMPFVISKCPSSFQKYNNPLVYPLNAVQQEVADEVVNAETIETSDLIIVAEDGTVLGTDINHYNGKDMETFGVRMGNKLLEMNGML